jgi:Xaa-Pro aminopeptidase
MWTDGRYFLQATEEMDENWTLMREGYWSKLPSTILILDWCILLRYIVRNK